MCVCVHGRGALKLKKKKEIRKCCSTKQSFSFFAGFKNDYEHDREDLSTQPVLEVFADPRNSLGFSCPDLKIPENGMFENCTFRARCTKPGTGRGTQNPPSLTPYSFLKPPAKS